jgi:hypothetical protein
MRLTDAIRDPVFQLNLLIWMAKPQPKDAYMKGLGVRPVFTEWGYRIISIEVPQTLSEATQAAIRASGVQVQGEVEPELALAKHEVKKGLVFEAKRDSFSPASTTSKQARAHLLLAGGDFADAFRPLEQGLCCYVVPGDRTQPMAECLAALTKELTDKALKPGVFSVHGLSSDQTGINYVWDAALKAHVGANDDSAVVMTGLADDTDPSPLILVYSDDDCWNEAQRGFYRQVMINQARSRLLCDLHNHEPGSEYAVTARDLLLRTTDGIFEYVGRQRQKNLTRLIRDNVIKRIHDYWKDRQPGVHMDKDGKLSIAWQVTSQKDEFTAWLEDRRVKFVDEKPAEEPEPTLFDGMGDAATATTPDS